MKSQRYAKEPPHPGPTPKSFPWPWNKDVNDWMKRADTYIDYWKSPPQDPKSGPPLPKKLRIKWPWYRS